MILQTDIHNISAVEYCKVFTSNEDKRDYINRSVKLIAYYIFHSHGNSKFSASYDALKGRVYLDHDFSIDSRLKIAGKGKSMFDVLSDNELDLVVESTNNLLSLYEGVINAKMNKDNTRSHYNN